LDNFQYHEDLEGLCQTCSNYGYKTFETISELITKDCTSTSHQSVLHNMASLSKRYIKKDYEDNLQVEADGTVLHNSCISHCLKKAFGECKEDHHSVCDKCILSMQLIDKLREVVKEEALPKVDILESKIHYWMAHQARKKYLTAQFNAALRNLTSEGAILLCDYKMKVNPRKSCKTKQD